ncbi:phosphopantetheine-binding protein [Streptomyces durbertensis]|uniref:Phosphopantetheine-binding protein n=1 Tax=Streptomyces durbertensis TaxID=2448886 RepID=A0ABR6EAL6_9ACTN|nr:phosphopantetheine-binding protein [Streptomyces durbertensis]MBB1242380.1 phosphopantetheine-binding protein [Streptomyces durbertensis]
MTPDEIFAVVRRNLLEVLPDLEEAQVSLEHSMRELGANSIDRMDVVMAVQDDLGVRVPASALTQANDLRSLVAVLGEYV